MLSNYFSGLGGSLRQGVNFFFLRQQSGVQESFEVLISHGRLLFGSIDLHVVVRPGSVAAAQANLHTVNRRKNISVAGDFSRAISIPSVSGPSFQTCGYHLDRLISEPDQVSSGIDSRKALMAVCGSKSSLFDCSLSKLTHRSMYHGVSAKANFTWSSKRSLHSYHKASMSLTNKELPNKFVLYGYFIYNVGKRNGKANPPFEGIGVSDIHTSSPACFSAGTAPASFDNSLQEDLSSSSTDLAEENIPAARILKLNSGSCYLPHPDKEETGGEDAHFICTDNHAIGVADGVGGWADLGVNAGLYARELMTNTVTAIQEEPRGSIDPARALEKAHSSTKARGSSTACIITLTEQGLHACNLGDSGFMVVREGSTVFRSPSQQHDFNFPYQLESGIDGDLPGSGEVFKIPVASGDVIIAGTDGLFDNLYNNEITAVVVHAVRAGFAPQVTAQKIAALARQRALDKNRQTPFSTAAQEAGFRYYGGKLDDITVVVSYITSDHNESSSTLQSS
ncbi:protein phosphatase [Lithospermum erythrorhizon]|uniref:Protein phosphatase n=1 Tax=Lithospermum erythrorhizon TaxID=34254 RepID=A0AAV3QWZ7_LITER